MKIICPKHAGLISLPDKSLFDTLQKNLKGFVFNCPECGGEVLITNIQHEIIKDKIPSMSQRAN